MPHTETGSQPPTLQCWPGGAGCNHTAIGRGDPGGGTQSRALASCCLSGCFWGRVAWPSLGRGQGPPQPACWVPCGQAETRPYIGPNLSGVKCGHASLGPGGAVSKCSLGGARSGQPQPGRRWAQVINDVFPPRTLELKLSEPKDQDLSCFLRYLRSIGWAQRGHS